MDTSQRVSLLERAKALLGVSVAPKDAAFVAAAPQLIRDLVAEVERLTGQGWQPKPSNGGTKMENGTSVPEPQVLCAETNPLVAASCRLPVGHEGPHWGHGATWTWDETMCQTVPPSYPPPLPAPPEDR